MKRAAKLAHIRQLSCLGIPGTSIMPALLKAVREFVGAESAAFFWVDTNGDITNLYAERVLPPKLMRTYFARHYDGEEHAFRQKFLARAQESDPVSSSSPSTEYVRTAYYNEILRHLDAHHVLYGVVRDQGSAIGQLSLYRSKDSRAFTAADRAAVRDISRYVAHAAARPANPDDPGRFVDGDTEGLVIVDADGRILRASPQSLHLLARAMRQNFNAHTLPLMIGDAATGIVRELIDRVESIRESKPAKPPRENVDGQWGRFQISAYALEGGPKGQAQIGIHVRHREPMMVRFIEAMGALDLSPQQREVALLLAQGKSNQEIATALSVSANTASYHVKQLFARLDAHDRAEAVARLMQEQ